MTDIVSSESTPVAQKPIRSSFADDADMTDILAIFVNEASSKIERLNHAIRRQDLNQIRVFSHQLKGAAAGYGFEPLSDLARDLESVTYDGEMIDIAERSQRVIDYLSSIQL